LLSAIERVRPIFTAAGHPLPERIKVSVGFGFATSGESRSILAQAWAACTSDDGSNAIFVSPILATADDALAALMHELVHVADDCAHGHGKVFGQIGAKVGLEGPKTSMLPGVALTAELITIVESLGTYPHARLDPDATRASEPGEQGDKPARGGRVHTGPARQTSRYFKAWCLQCGYMVHTTRKWLEIAIPVCPVCMQTMEL
jgi:hypothetical protein